MCVLSLPMHSDDFRLQDPIESHVSSVKVEDMLCALCQNRSMCGIVRHVFDIAVNDVVVFRINRYVIEGRRPDKIIVDIAIHFELRDARCIRQYAKYRCWSQWLTLHYVFANA